MKLAEFITLDPMFYLAMGITPDAVPETEILFVVYRGHEPKWGTLTAAMPGSFCIKDSVVAEKTEFSTEIVCVCDREEDAKRIVTEKNAALGPNDVHFKYHGELMFSGLYAGFDVSQLETVAVITDSEHEYSVSRIEPVYALMNEEAVLKKVDRNNSEKNTVRLYKPESACFVPYVEASAREMCSLS